MNKQTVMVFCVILFSCFLLAKQTKSPFIAKKKMRGLSKSKLKEQNAQELGALLQTLPSLIKSIAQTQELAMERLTQYLEGEKKCFWAQASCEELLGCKNRTQVFQQNIEQMQVQLQNFISFLDKMKVSDSANLISETAKKLVKKV